MKFLSKLSLFLLIGCSSIDFGYLTLIKEINSSNQIHDISTFLDGDYSFIRASQGKNQAIMILSNYSDGIETWIGAGSEKIVTYNGLIIASYGLTQDFFIHRFETIKDLFLRNNFSAYVNFSNPDANFIQAKFSLDQNYKKICNNQYNYNVRYYEIGDDIISICFDDGDKPTYTSQLLNPQGKRITIEYFYKYK